MDNKSLEDITNELNSFNQEIPPWAELLIQSMQTIINELKCVKDLAERISELESFKVVSDTVTTRLHNENTRLANLITNLESKVDDQEQRSRNYCLLFHGIPENVNEKTDDIALEIMNTDLGLNDVAECEIQRSHRLGQKVTERRNLRSNAATAHPRPIIVRFSNFKTRMRVFKNKKSLKGQNISITENLTRLRVELLKKAGAKYGRDKVWTHEGRIMTKFNDQYITINSDGDL